MKAAMLRWDPRAWLVLSACMLISAVLLAVDVRFERGLVLGIPQILVVLIALLAQRTSVSIAGACLASVAIALGYLWSSGTADETALVNRMLAGGAVWMTAAAGIALERSVAAQRRLAEIVEASSDAISRVSLDGIVTAWNAGAERIYGWRAEDVIGQPVPEQQREIVARVARGERISTFESVDRSRDGTPLELSIAVLPLHGARGRITAVSVSARDIAPRKRAERALRELNDSLALRIAERTCDLERSLAELGAEVTRRREAERGLRSLTAELLIVEERERRQIAQDLHDGLGQTLTLAIMRLGMLRERARSDDRQVLAELEELLCGAQQSATSMTFRLSPPVLYDVGFVPAVQWLCDELERSYGLEVQLDDDEKPKTLDDHMRVIVFRCVRELLINVAKHAATGSAHVIIRRRGENLRVVVSDEGVGFEPDSARTRGFGVASIRERLEHLGGSLSIDSQPGKGTKATIIAPLVHRDTPEAHA